MPRDNKSILSVQFGVGVGAVFDEIRHNRRVGRASSRGSAGCACAGACHSSFLLLDRLKVVLSERGNTSAEVAQGTPTQSRMCTFALY